MVESIFFRKFVKFTLDKFPDALKGNRTGLFSHASFGRRGMEKYPKLYGFFVGFCPCGRTAPCIILLSCMMELIQLGMIVVFHCVSKAFDVKDILLNLAGGLLGLILFEALAAAVRKVIHLEVKSGFLKYIYEQCGHFSRWKTR